MIAATGAGEGDTDTSAKQNDARQVSQEGPRKSLKRPALHALSVSIASRSQGADCRSRVIYGADRNNLLPPLGAARYIGLDTEQDSSFEFVLMGVPLSGIAPKRCNPFILTTPSGSPDKEFASIRNGSRVLNQRTRHICFPEFVASGSASGVGM
jgi:hypothetical protein